MASPIIPTHHKAAVYDKPGQISTRLSTVETPSPGPGEVLIHLTHSGVCSSDHGIMTNQWTHLPPTPADQIGGHEGVGTIVAFGSDPPNSTKLRLGDRVGIKWIASVCGTCMACLAGRDAMCPAAQVSGFYRPGTFQQYVVAPASYVTPIPDGVPSDLAAPLLCGGVTVYAALKKSRAQPGIDSGEKEEFVKSLGAEAFFDMTKYSRDQAGSDKLAQDVKAATLRGMGAASVIVCAGSNTAYAQALGFLGFGGTLVCTGLPAGAPVPIAGAFPGNLVGRELAILGSAVGNRKEAIETLDLAARGVVKTHFALEPMSKLTEVFERMERMELQGRVVLDLSRED